MERFTEPVEGQNDGQETAATRRSPPSYPKTHSKNAKESLSSIRAIIGALAEKVRTRILALCGQNDPQFSRSITLPVDAGFQPPPRRRSL